MRTGQIFTVISDQPIDRQIYFADQHAVSELIDDAPHLRDHVQHLWSIRDRKSTRLNSSHANISYAVFCLKKKKQPAKTEPANKKPNRGGQARPPGNAT